MFGLLHRMDTSKIKLILKIILVKLRHLYRYHYVLLMFHDANEIVVDMLEVHDLIVKDLKLTKVSQIPRLRSRMCLGQDLMIKKVKVCMKLKLGM